jgi:hypothetical protein
VGCWAPKDTPIAVAQTSGRQRLNIHGAIDLETGRTRMLEVETVDAASTIKLMIALLTMYPRKRVIHLFLDNARYHHAKLVRAWLARPSLIPSFSLGMKESAGRRGDSGKNRRSAGGGISLRIRSATFAAA